MGPSAPPFQLRFESSRMHCQAGCASVSMRWVAARLVEKPQVLWLSALNIGRRSPSLSRMVPSEIWIKLRGLWFRIATAQGEMDGFLQAWLLGIYEPDPVFVAGPGDVVVDGGANVGFYSALQASRGARVIAFEPNPATFERLRASLSRNHLDTLVTAIPAALSDRTERRKFYFSEVDTIGGSLFTASNSHHPAADVDVVTLDEALNRLGIETVDLLKLDVEGAECLALAGAGPLLSRARGVVLEYHSCELRDCCEHLLRKAGL